MQLPTMDTHHPENRKMAQWRRFNFFDRVVVTQPQDGDIDDGQDVRSLPHSELLKLDPICATSSGNGVVAGLSDGRVAILGDDFQVTTFLAHTVRTTNIAAIEIRGEEYLVTCGDGPDPRLPEEAAATMRMALSHRQQERTAGQAEDQSRGVSPEDATGPNARFDQPKLCVWRLSRSHEDRLSLVQEVSLPLDPSLRPGAPESRDNCTVNALDIARDGSFIAVGMRDGSVFLFSGDLSRERTTLHARRVAFPTQESHARDRTTRADSQGTSTSSSSSQGDPVTGLHFALRSHDAEPVPRALRRGNALRHGPMGETVDDTEQRKFLMLYVTTVQHIFAVFPRQGGFGSGSAFPSLGRNRLPSKVPATCIASSGCAIDCSAVLDDGFLAVGRPEGVFFYSHEEIAGTVGLPGLPTHIAWFHGYLIVSAVDAHARETLSVYDLPNHHTAFWFILPATDLGAADTDVHALSLAARRRTEVTSRGGIRSGPRAQAGAGGGGGGGSESLVRGGAGGGNGAMSRFPLGTSRIEQSKPTHWVRHIVFAWDQIFVWGSNGIVYSLREKTTETKLETLFRANKFDIALSLAKASGYDEAAIVDIYRHYGDYLYAKEDYEGAMAQYCCTIKYVEPSYVIRRYLEAPRILQLIQYLEELHHRRAALPEHTTLLINCYTKAKKTEELDRFIRRGFRRTALPPTSSSATRGDAGANAGDATSVDGRSHTSGDDDDAHERERVRHAIQVLRDAGYTNAALELAFTHGCSEEYLSLEVEERAGWDEAIAFLHTLQFADAERALLKYGPKLLSVRPLETTRLVEMLCTTGTPSLGSDGANGRTGDSHARRSDPDAFFAMYATHPVYLKRLLRAIVAFRPDSASPGVWDTLLELTLRPDVAELADPDAREDENGEEEKSGSPATEDPHASVVEGILRHPAAKYNPDRALLLCRMYDCEEGLLFLLTKKQLYMTVLEHHGEALREAVRDGRWDDRSRRSQQILRTCEAHGDKEPSLWTTALSLLIRTFAGSGTDSADRGGAGAGGGGADAGGVSAVGAGGAGSGDRALEEGKDEAKWAPRKDDQRRSRRAKEEVDALRKCIEVVEEKQLLPPLMVVNMVAQNPAIPLHVIRDFLVHTMSEQEETLEDHRHAIQLCRRHTDQMWDETHTLRTKGKVFRHRKCALTGTELEFPSVHFMCGGVRPGQIADDEPLHKEHSFQQHVVLEGVSADAPGRPRCPICADEQRNMFEAKRQMAQQAMDQETFMAQLRRSQDGFHEVTKFFGHGLFDPMVLSRQEDATAGGENGGSD